MNKRIRTLALSMIVLCISCTIVVGGTFALFSDTDTVSNHLSAGSLDIALDRTEYREYVLAKDGTMTLSAPNTDRIDYATDEKVLFNMVSAVPSSWYQATLEIANEGNTAYDYSVRVLWNTDGKATSEQITFAQQIRITITSDKIDNAEHTVSFMLSECANNTVSLGYMLKGADPESFTIKAEFVDDENNNAAMRVTLDFDVQVLATQKVAKD